MIRQAPAPLPVQVEPHSSAEADAKSASADGAPMSVDAGGSSDHAPSAAGSPGRRP